MFMAFKCIDITGNNFLVKFSDEDSDNETISKASGGPDSWADSPPISISDDKRAKVRKIFFSLVIEMIYIFLTLLHN